MFRRNILESLEKALKRSPVVLLNGARQIGKTTLATTSLDHKKYTYRTFDDEVDYLAARANPAGYIEDLEKPVIIDEVQRVPEIFRAIKRDVDKNRHVGRYLLTGSANPLLIPRLGDSLAGRMEIIDMMPLSQGEIEGVQDNFIDALFVDKKIASVGKGITKETLFKKIVTGGYPQVQDVDQEQWAAWLKSYVGLILRKDVRDLSQIEKMTDFPRLLSVLASRSACLTNVAEIGRETGLIDKTAHRYVALLEAVFIVHSLNPWSRNLNTRASKTTKLYMVDTGLASHLLNLNAERLADDGIVSGRLVETFVVNELKKQITWSVAAPEMYHFRTVSGTEVDVVLEDRSGNVAGIEIKTGSRVSPEDFKGLRLLQDKSKNKFLIGVILYTGSLVVPFGDKMFAVPINSLWEGPKN